MSPAPRRHSPGAAASAAGTTWLMVTLPWITPVLARLGPSCRCWRTEPVAGGLSGTFSANGDAPENDAGVGNRRSLDFALLDRSGRAPGRAGEVPQVPRRSGVTLQMIGDPHGPHVGEPSRHRLTLRRIGANDCRLGSVEPAV